MRAMIAAAAMLLGQGASAQPTPYRIDISLESFRYTPRRIPLHHGQRYLLHFTNKSDGGHDFEARRFFALARIESGGQAVRGGKVELAGGQSAEVGVIAPPPGRYKVRCTHFLHATFGMNAEIVVD